MTLKHEVAGQYLQLGPEHLDPAQRAALATHLTECAECRAYAEQVTALAPRLAQALQAHWGRGPGPASSVAAIQKRLRRQTMVKQAYAAAGNLAGVVLFAVFAFMLSGLLDRRPGMPLVTPTAQLSAAVIVDDFALEPPAVHAGETLTLTVHWRASVPLTEAYTVFVHLLDSSNSNLLAAMDSAPSHPTVAWMLAAPYTDTFTHRIDFRVAVLHGHEHDPAGRRRRRSRVGRAGFLFGR